MPETVTIPAGQSAVEVQIIGIDDTVIDGKSSPLQLPLLLPDSPVALMTFLFL